MTSKGRRHGLRRHLGFRILGFADGRVDSLGLGRQQIQRVLLPVSTNHTVCSMILKSNLSDMFSM